MAKGPMIEERSWEEFRDAGLLWWANRILHLFGWAICVEIDDDVIDRAYPARSRFRGFAEANESLGHVQLTRHMAENIAGLMDEIEGRND